MISSTYKFFTYFDLLGYRNFLDKNTIETHQKVINQFFVHIDSALNLEKKYRKTSDGSIINDLTRKHIHFANYSDTVILWTDGNDFEEFIELLRISYECNWRMNLYHFPIRGVLVYKELKAINFTSSQTSYQVNSFYGKGLIKAHDLAESQEWAGMILDESLFEIIDEKKLEIDKMCIKYHVPFKNSLKVTYAMKMVVNLNNSTALKSTLKNIEDNFRRYDKWDDSLPSLKKKLENTSDFIRFLKDK
jgi:hypothetical protein